MSFFAKISCVLLSLWEFAILLHHHIQRTRPDIPKSSQETMEQLAQRMKEEMEAELWCNEMGVTAERSERNTNRT